MPEPTAPPLVELIGIEMRFGEATGLGAFISNAQANGDFPGLAASVLAMALFVVFFNRTVWKRLSAIAQDRYQLLT